MARFYEDDHNDNTKGIQCPPESRAGSASRMFLQPEVLGLCLAPSGGCPPPERRTTRRQGGGGPQQLPALAALLRAGRRLLVAAVCARGAQLGLGRLAALVGLQAVVPAGAEAEEAAEAVAGPGAQLSVADLRVRTAAGQRHRSAGGGRTRALAGREE